MHWRRGREDLFEYTEVIENTTIKYKLNILRNMIDTIINNFNNFNQLKTLGVYYGNDIRPNKFSKKL